MPVTRSAQFLRALCFLTVAVFIALPATWASQKREVSFEDLQLLSDQAYEIALAPNGRWLAIQMKDGLIVLDAKTKETIASLGPGIIPAWSRDSRTLAFYSNRSGKLQIWAWQTAAAEPKQTTQFDEGLDPDPTTRIAGTDSDSMRMSWSPDSRFIVFASRAPYLMPDFGENSEDGSSESDDGENAPLVLTNSTPSALTLSGIFLHSNSISGVLQIRDGRTWSYRAPRTGERLNSQLFIAEIKTGHVKQLTHGARSWFHPVWSPDGRNVACVTTAGESVSVGEAQSLIVTVEAVSGKQRVIAAERGLKFQPKWSPDGKSIAYLSSETTFGRPDLLLHKYPDGQPVKIPFIDRQIRSFYWASDSTMLVLFKNGPSIRLGLIKLDPVATVTDLNPAQQEIALIVSGVGVSDAGGIAWTQYDPEELSTVRLLDRVGAVPKVLIRGNKGSDEMFLPKSKLVRWRNGRGDEMQGSILFPPAYRADERYPMIVDAYPNINGADWADPMTGNFAMATKGYVIFRPSGRAPHAWVNPWTTKAWSLAAKGAAGWEVSVDDLMSGVDELIHRGIADPERMCLYGFSNGGGVVNYLVTRTSRFKCAVSVSAALTDWVRPALLDPDFDPLFAGTDIDTNVNEYVKLSSVFRLANVRTPMLLANGDLEVDFLLDGIEMYNGLRRLGKPVTFVRYPGQGHGLTGEALKDFWRREMEFFGRHLMR